MLRDVLIDLHGWHGAADVRLQSRYPVFGDRKTRVIVRPRSDVVGGPRLQLAQRVRFLYLDKENAACLFVISCNNNAFLRRGRSNRIVYIEEILTKSSHPMYEKYIQNQHSLDACSTLFITFVNAKERGEKMLGKINPEKKRNSQSLQKYFALAQPNV